MGKLIFHIEFIIKIILFTTMVFSFALFWFCFYWEASWGARVTPNDIQSKGLQFNGKS